MSTYQHAAAFWASHIGPAAVQIAVVALVCAVGIHALGPRAPRVRVWLTGVLLLKLALTPWLQLSTSAFPGAAGVPAEAPDALLGEVTATPPTLELHTALGEPIAASTAHDGARTPTPAHAPVRLASALLLTHLIGIAVRLGIACAEAVRLARLARRSRTPSAATLVLARRMTARVGLRTTPRIRVSHETDVPFCFGALRPTIVLPSSAAQASGLETVLAHELLHIRHHDLAWNLARVLATALWWFHPAAWWVARPLRAAQEDRVDDALVHRTGIDPLRYGQVLVRAARATLTAPHAASLTLSMARPEHPLARRLRRITNPNLHSETSTMLFALPIALGLTLIPSARPAALAEGPASDGAELAAAQTTAAAPAPRTLDRSLAWLAAQQRPDGSFAETGLTDDGWALLALVGAGTTSKAGPHRETVAASVAYLTEHLTRAEDPASTLDRGASIAALALTEHYLLSGQPEGDRAAIAAVAARVSASADGTGRDPAAAFAATLTLLSARDAGIEVDEAALQSLRARLPLDPLPDVAGWSGATTAGAAIFLDALTTEKGGDSPARTAAVERVLGTLTRPVTADPLRMYIGSIALYQVGGDAWRHWVTGPLTRLEGAAEEDGGFAAPEGLGGGRVAATALSALALEARFRYARVVDPEGGSGTAK